MRDSLRMQGLVTHKLSRAPSTFRPVMKRFDPARAQPAGPTLRFYLRAPGSGLEAAVELRQVPGRWISVSAATGQRVTAIGGTARGAVVASLAWLGPTTVSELLADLRLLDVSRQVRALTTANATL